MAKPPLDVYSDLRMKKVLAGNLLKHLRKLGITQTELATRAGIGKQTLNSYFVQKSIPGPANLDNLARALGTTAEDLLPDTSRAVVEEMFRGQVANEDTPKHALTALPTRPGFSRLELRADIPTALAVQIMAMLPSEVG